MIESEFIKEYKERRGLRNLKKSKKNRSFLGNLSRCSKGGEESYF